MVKSQQRASSSTPKTNPPSSLASASQEDTRKSPRLHWVLFQDFPKVSPDGQPARVLVLSIPTRFWRLEVQESNDSVGDVLPAWALETGGGDAAQRLVLQVADAASKGMIQTADPTPATLRSPR